MSMGEVALLVAGIHRPRKRVGGDKKIHEQVQGGSGRIDPQVWAGDKRCYC